MAISRHALEQAVTQILEIAARQPRPEDAAALREAASAIERSIVTAENLGHIAIVPNLSTPELRATAIMLVDPSWLPKEFQRSSAPDGHE